MPPDNAAPLRHDFPIWAVSLQLSAAFLFWFVLPFFISMLSHRHGWSAGHPRQWNLLGLIPVVAGMAIIFSVAREHQPRARQHGWRFEKTPFEAPQYLIESGPYRLTRNPIYVTHIMVWSGWAIFYGSIAVLITVAAIWIALSLIVLPYEERRLTEQFGESYKQYKTRVPRWLGRLAR
jgi:protein-S-isoprenylcysteine O-methyltransferase Ste14